MIHQHPTTQVLRDSSHAVVDTVLHQYRAVMTLVCLPLTEQISGNTLSQPIGIGYSEGEGESEELLPSWSPLEGFLSASTSASVCMPESFRAFQAEAPG